jgi:hypothetical protein
MRNEVNETILQVTIYVALVLVFLMEGTYEVGR